MASKEINLMWYGLMMAVVVILLLITVLSLNEEAQNDDQCKFIVKTTELPAHISEPEAGSYNYQLVVTDDGYVTISKCQ